MTGTPIKREDIKAGDKIAQTFTFTADIDGQHIPGLATFELLDRPVVLPTEIGCTIKINGNHNGTPSHGPGSRFVRAEGSEAWFNYRGPVSPEIVKALASEHGFTIVGRPVAEVAAEVCAEILAEFKMEANDRKTWVADVQTVAERWATK